VRHSGRWAIRFRTLTIHTLTSVVHARRETSTLSERKIQVAVMTR
jgi:hypothetical protein